MKEHPDLYRTVVVNGLPRDVTHDELMGFFCCFYPIERIKMLSSTCRSDGFSGKIHVTFVNEQDAARFVQQSDSTPLIYANDGLLQICHGYTLVCQVLATCDDQDVNNLDPWQNGR